MRRIGVLMLLDENDPAAKTYASAFTQALADLGWTDGRNMRMDLRWAGGDPNRIPALAQELVGLKPDIILSHGAEATPVLQRETRTIPIVFVSVTDPVAISIVARLDRPSGNITGFANLEATLGAKWLELLSEIAPDLKRAAIMFNPDRSPARAYIPLLETAARSLKVEPIIAPVHSDLEIETARFSAARRHGRSWRAHSSRLRSRCIMSLGSEPGGGLVVVKQRTSGLLGI
jgi:putative ABC transport system substrate-binding protein